MHVQSMGHGFGSIPGKFIFPRVKSNGEFDKRILNCRGQSGNRVSGNFISCIPGIGQSDIGVGGLFLNFADF